MSKSIEDWLRDPRDYQQGVALLSEVCKNKVLIANLAKKENESNFERLVYQLRKHQTIRSNTKAHPKQNPAPKKTSSPGVNSNPQDSILARLSEEKGLIHLERAREANRMKFCTNDSQRKRVYENCLEIQGRYDQKAKQINHYLRHGSLLKDELPKTSTFRLSEDPMDWRRQLQNARSNRSKLLKKIEAHAKDHPKQPVWKKKLNQIQKDIEQIENNIQSQKAAKEAGLA